MFKEMEILKRAAGPDKLAPLLRLLFWDKIQTIVTLFLSASPLFLHKAQDSVLIQPLSLYPANHHFRHVVMAAREEQDHIWSLWHNWKSRWMKPVSFIRYWQRLVKVKLRVSMVITALWSVTVECNSLRRLKHRHGRLVSHSQNIDGSIRRRNGGMKKRKSRGGLEDTT